MGVKIDCSEIAAFPLAGQFVRAFSYTNYSIRPHNHDFYEMNIVLFGKGVHQIENTQLSVEAGDVFVIPPMTVHAYYNTDNLEVYHVLIRKDFIRENRAEASLVPGFLQLVEIEPFLRQSCSESMFLHLSHAQLERIKLDARIIEDDGDFNDECFAPLRKHTVWKLLYSLSNMLHEQMNDTGKRCGVKYKRQMLDALGYIHNRFNEKITVESLYECTYLSRSTFLRSFRAICGCSPMQYLNQYRTNKAVELLESKPKMSKTEVAHSCGFYDLSHMERAIKKTTDKLSLE